MSIPGDGLGLIAIALLATVIGYALALYRRSWSMWLIAFTLTVVTLGIAWFVSHAPMRIYSLLSETPL